MREFKFRAWTGNEFIHFGLFSDDAIRYMDIHQFTGLKDNNGKEVFEGDLVKIKALGALNEIHEVRFASGGFMAGDAFLDDYWNLLKGHMFEVVGNKFENPEMLEGVKND